MISSNHNNQAFFRYLICLLAIVSMIFSAARVHAQANAFEKQGRNDLVARISANGQMRVIAGAKVTAPSGLHSAAARKVRHNEYEKVINGILKRSGGHGVKEIKRFVELPYMTLEVDAQGLARLLADPDVRSVEEELRLQPHLFETPGIVRADSAWNSGYKGQGQAVAILDSGVDTSHPFLAGNLAAEACFSTPAGGVTSLCPNGQASQIGPGAGTFCPDLDLGCYHGTHVAGIAVGREGVLGGTAGMAPGAALMPVQVFAKECDFSGCALSASSSDLVAALEWVYGQHDTYSIAAVNMSLGSGGYSSTCDTLSPSMKAAIDLLRSVGIATVVSSGNDGFLSQLSFPACISSAVSVGSTSKQNQVSSFSNAASYLSLLAPGQSIYSSYPGGSFVSRSGTSMAAPHVAGAWALLKAARPVSTVQEVLDAFQITGLPISDYRQGLVKPLIQIGDAPGSPGALGVLLGQPGGSTNHALPANGGIASASSVHSAGYPVAAVNNGDRSGDVWGSGGGWNDATRDSYPDWVQIDFSGAKNINEIVVVTLQDNYQLPVNPTDATTFSLYGITAFEVQYWNGGDWATVPGGSVTGNSHVLRRFTFLPLITSKIRVQVNASLGGYSRIVEIEAWGENSSANQPPLVSLTSPAPGVTFSAPADIILTASASDPDGSVAKVEFFQGAVKLGESLAPPYTLLWPDVPAGNYTLTAVATDNSGAAVTSQPADITVTGSVALVNHALASNGGVASASSVHSAGYPVAAVNNGDRTGAGWASGGGWNDATKNIYPDWVQIDFNGLKNVSEITVVTLQDNYITPIEPTEATSFSLYGITDFELQYWTGSVWTTLPGGSIAGNGNVMRHIQFSPVSTEKIRVLVNGSLAGYSRIVEIEAWGEPSAPVVNHALAVNGAVASASTVHSAAYPVAAVNNGERAGINWGSGGGWNDSTRNVYLDWVQIDFNGQKMISAVDVFTLQDNYTSPVTPTLEMPFSLYGITAFDVQYWDGSSWVTLPGGAVIGNSKVWRRFQFVPVRTESVRVLVSAGLGGYSRIVEIEAWGAP